MCKAKEEAKTRLDRLLDAIERLTAAIEQSQLARPAGASTLPETAAPSPPPAH